MSRFRIYVSASRFDRSPKSLTQDVQRWQEIRGSKKIDPSIGLLTEIAGDEREKATEINGWKTYVGPDLQSRDSGVSHDPSKWHLLYQSSDQISDVEFRRGGSTVSPGVFAATKVLQDRETGDIVVVSMSHYPASVQHGAQWDQSNQDRVRSHRAATRGHRILINQVVRNHARPARDAFKQEFPERARPKIGVVIGFDGNLNILLDVWREHYEREFPGYVHGWGNDPQPDIGGRAITLTMIRGLKVVEGAREVKTSSSDHDAHMLSLKHVSGASWRQIKARKRG